MRYLIEAIVKTKKKKTTPATKPKSFFDLHYDHHKKAQVDTTSYQAKRLGLHYLGFGRYGKIEPGKNTYTVTHIVKNGLLREVEHEAGDSTPKIAAKQDENLLQQEAARLKKLDLDDINGSDRIKSLNSYVWNDFQHINKLINNGLEKKASPQLIKIMNDIDALFKSEAGKLGIDMAVYKQTSVPLSKGKTFQQIAYTSTATDISHVYRDESEAKENIDDEPPALIQLELKKGQRAIYVDAMLGFTDTSKIKHPRTDEVLLPRNSRFKITDGPIYTKNAVMWKAELDQDEEDFVDEKKMPDKPK